MQHQTKASLWNCLDFKSLCIVYRRKQSLAIAVIVESYKLHIYGTAIDEYRRLIDTFNRIDAFRSIYVLARTKFTHLMVWLGIFGDAEVNVHNSFVTRLSKESEFELFVLDQVFEIASAMEKHLEQQLFY